MNRRLVVLLALAAGSLFGIALVLVRNLHTGNPNFRYLIWNLFLAWIPFVVALAAYVRRQGIVTAALGVAWLVFFPNAPYIVTDFVHLEHDPLSPLWYDAVTIGAFAVTGLALAFASLYLMHVVVRRALGKRASWIAVVVASALAGVGVYAGRYVRLNSWDFLTKPHLFARLVRLRLTDPFGNPKLLAVAFLFTVLLSAGYAAVYAVVAPRLEPRGR